MKKVQRQRNFLEIIRYGSYFQTAYGQGREPRLPYMEENTKPTINPRQTAYKSLVNSED